MSNDSTIQIVEWVSRESGSLRGFVTSKMRSGMVIHEAGAFEQNGKWWVAPPGKPMISRDGVVMRDDKGKIRYSPVVTFADKSTSKRWSDAVIQALHAAHPELLG